MFQKETKSRAERKIETRNPAGENSLLVSDSETAAAKLLGENLNRMANVLAAGQAAEDKSYIKKLIQSRLKSGKRPMPLNFYAQKMEEATDAISPAERKNRTAMMEKLCANNILYACTFVYYDFKQIHFDKIQAEYEITKNADLAIKRNSDTPEMVKMSVYSCVETGSLCWQAMSALRGTENGKLLETLANDYCKSDLEAVCEDLRYELRSRVRSTPENFCQNLAECQTPNKESQEKDRELLLDISSRTCREDNVEACEVLVETSESDKSSVDSRGENGRTTLLTACENQNPTACESVTRWALEKNDFETARLYADPSCAQGDQFSCLQLVAVDFKANNQNPESLRPALERFCQAASPDRVDPQSVCGLLAKTNPLTTEFLKQQQYSADYNGRGAAGGLWDYLIYSH